MACVPRCSTSSTIARTRASCTSSRGRRGDKIKILWYSGDGLALFYKRLSTGIFTWPQVKDGTVQLSSAQLSMLLEGIDGGRLIARRRRRRIRIERIRR